MILRQVLLTSCAFVAAVSAPAMAQEVPAQSPGERASTSDDIVVTARRREERSQDVPVAIAAFSQKTLETQGVRTVSDLRMVAPGLNAQSTSISKSKPVYELRGIFPNDVLVGQDQAVGIYVNEVYLARPFGTNQSLFDISNAQVLYGPQGTLFGRNTTAGAVLINTNKPTDRLEGEVWGGISNYDGRLFGATLNLPVSEVVQVRVAGQRETRNGYSINVLNGQDLDDTGNYGLRASIRITPSNRLESVFIADYFRSDTNGQGGVLTPLASSGQTVTLADGSRVLLSGTAAALYPELPRLIAEQEARGPRRIASDQVQSETAKSWGVANTTSFDAQPGLTIKNIMAYRESSLVVFHDTDRSAATPLTGGRPIGGRSHQFSDELQLQGKSFDNKLTWIIGGFFFRESGNELNIAEQLTGTANFTRTNLEFRAVNISKSVFAQGTYALTDKLNLTAGGRYTWDTRNAYYGGTTLLARGTPEVSGNNACLYAATFDPNGDCTEFRTASYKQPTYTLSVDYKPSSDLMLYVAHRRGYRSGGFNGRATNNIGAQPFSPEKITDIEIGAKGQVHLGGEALLTFDAAAYQMKYSNLQRSIVVINPDTNAATSVIVNAAGSTIRGFELKSTLRPVRPLLFSAGWSHNVGRYDKFDGVQVCPALPTICTSSNRILTSLHNLPFGTSKDVFNGSVTLTPIDSPEIGLVTLTGTMSYRSKAFVQNEAPVLAAVIPAYSVYNLSLNWDDIAGTRLSAQAYVKNVTDKAYIIGGLAILTSFGFNNYFYGEPRIYGLNLRYKF